MTAGKETCTTCGGSFAGRTGTFRITYVTGEAFCSRQCEDKYKAATGK